MAANLSYAFNIKQNFFLIDSNTLNSVQTSFYGFTILEEKPVKNLESISSVVTMNNPGTNKETSALPKPTYLGAYVYIERTPEQIIITQDFVGSYGIYLYKDNDYFALSNSFLLLVEHVKTAHKISFNHDYANFFLITELCSVAYSETMINEIEVLDRSAIVKIDITQKKLNIDYIDYEENTVELNSKEGLMLLDDWYNKWISIIRSLVSQNSNIQIDLSGGIDSRLTFILMLGAGVDLNKIYINSIKDELHTHKEDFEIASQISNYYHFPLNNTDNLTQHSINYALQDILNISFYTKLSFHKQMNLKTNFIIPERHYFGGSGGECIRSYWNMSKDEYIEQCIRRCKPFSTVNSKRFENSIRTILGSAFTKIENKFKSYGRPLKEEDMTLNLYRETRCRNHFGKDVVENFLGGLVKYSPLLDPQLHKLKLHDRKCRDNNLLIAVIFDRYCRDILNFKFNGNRKIDGATLDYAQKINHHFPFAQNNEHVNHGIMSLRTSYKRPDAILQRQSSGFSKKEINRFVENLFYSKYLNGLLLTLYDNEIYDYILNDMKTKKYQPLENVYVALSITTVLQNIYANNIMRHNTFSNYIVHNLCIEASQILKRHPYLDNYITARIDIKNTSLLAGSNIADEIQANDIEILEMSDQMAKISSPDWFNGNGKGYVIESKAGWLTVIFKCIYNGHLSITLRGRDVRNKNNQKIPFWIDYHSMTFNDEKVFDTIKPVWHDKVFSFNRLVQNNEIVSLNLKWEPHDHRK